MRKVVVMLDGSFVLKVLSGRLSQRPTAEQAYEFAMACVDEGDQEELLRIYYYDCPPYGSTEVHPLSGASINFSAKPLFNLQKAFQDKLSRMDHIAFRRGVLSFYGWKIGKIASQQLIRTRRPIQNWDLVPNLKQKRVDMKIGLDIAWLSSKKIVDRIILVTGDADFIPAMKFARREGVQVVLVTLGKRVKPEMREHTDLFREVNWPSAATTT